MEAAEAPRTSATRPTFRVFVSDTCTGKQFLVDSGAEISVLPPTAGARPVSDIVLTAANVTRIKTYGPKTLRLCLGVKRTYAWTFKMADVARPIIGADFLHYFGLLINVNNHRLIDPSDQNLIQTISVDDVSAPTLVVSHTRKWTELLHAFPDVTRESPVPTKFKHNVDTSYGLLLFARPRRLPPECSQVARREFDYIYIYI